jgi:hypothetical protein
MRIRFLRGLIPALALAALPAISSAGVFVGVSVNVAPPALPAYVQPPCPEPGYMWSPGYWAWNDGGYYWVPGTWVLPPEPGVLWTPGYWGWGGGVYMWHAGYWGPHVGFYGGVNYGFGYDGAGFVGGYWRGREFYYNRAVMHVGPTFAHNVYYRSVSYHTTYEHVSFNGGPGGVRAQPTRAQMAAAHEHHVAFTSVQQRQQRMAFADRSLRADYNHGRPPVAATARAAVFHGSGTFAARAAGGPMHTTARHTAAVTRSDRPSWASGRNNAARPMGHGKPAHGRPGFAGSQQQNFQPRPQHDFAAHGNRPTEHSQGRQPPQFHQNNFKAPPHGPARGAAPHPQKRGGGERPHRPPEQHNR